MGGGILKWGPRGTLGGVTPWGTLNGVTPGGGTLGEVIPGEGILMVWYGMVSLSYWRGH